MLLKIPKSLENSHLLLPGAIPEGLAAPGLSGSSEVGAGDGKIWDKIPQTQPLLLGKPLGISFDPELTIPVSMGMGERR